MIKLKKMKKIFFFAICFFSFICPVFAVRFYFPDLTQKSIKLPSITIPSAGDVTVKTDTSPIKTPVAVEQPSTITTIVEKQIAGDVSGMTFEGPNLLDSELPIMEDTFAGAVQKPLEQDTKVSVSPTPVTPSTTEAQTPAPSTPEQLPLPSSPQEVNPVVVTKIVENQSAEVTSELTFDGPNLVESELPVMEDTFAATARTVFISDEPETQSTTPSLQPQTPIPDTNVYMSGGQQPQQYEIPKPTIQQPVEQQPVEQPAEQQQTPQEIPEQTPIVTPPPTTPEPIVVTKVVEQQTAEILSGIFEGPDLTETPAVAQIDTKTVTPEPDTKPVTPEPDTKPAERRSVSPSS